MTKKDLLAIKKILVLSGLYLTIAATENGALQKAYQPKKINIEQEDLDIKKSSFIPSIVTIKKNHSEKIEELAENRVSSHQEDIPLPKKVPIIKQEEKHHMPSLDEIIVYIKNKRGISDKDFDTLVNEFVESSKEYSVSYTREQAIKVWYLVTVKPTEDKVSYIVDRWGMTKEELLLSEACATAESKKNSQNLADYVDSFTLTDTAIGRTKDKGYSKSGGDVYDQFTMKGQFAVYGGGNYKNYLDVNNYGFLDALFAYAYTKDLGLTPLRTRFYKEFRSANSYVSNPKQMVYHGNKYNANMIIRASNSTDSYEPYRSLTDEYFHQIMDERELCHVEKLERIIGYEYKY